MTADKKPIPALSVRQPWAWLIVSGFKDIENRMWRTTYRGPVWIHAGKQFDKDAEFFLKCEGLPEPPDYKGLELGGIVGMAEIVDCVDDSASPWFCGLYGFVLANPRAVPFVPCKGQLGFFNLDEKVAEQLRLGVSGETGL